MVVVELLHEARQIMTTRRTQQMEKTKTATSDKKMFLHHFPSGTNFNGYSPDLVLIPLYLLPQQLLLLPQQRQQRHQQVDLNLKNWPTFCHRLLVNHHQIIITPLPCLSYQHTGLVNGGGITSTSSATSLSASFSCSSFSGR